jgi:single-strand DNA-binding protein
MKYTASGNPITIFSLAVSHRYKTSDGELLEKTDWFPVVCWNKLAEIANQYVCQGHSILVSGKLSTRQWTDQQGNQHERTEVIANVVKSLDYKKEYKKETEEDFGGEEIPDDVPF